MAKSVAIHMTLLDRYLAKTVMLAIALVTFTLLALNGFILSVNQLDDLGKGNFGVLQAAEVVLLSVPYQVYLFFPVASLLGCLLGLGLLANNHELIVMRAAGVSIMSITRSVLKVALILIILVTVLGETLVPKGLIAARDHKTHWMTGTPVLRMANNVWLRSGSDFMVLGRVLPHNRLQHVVQFRFDVSHRLRLTRRLDAVEYVHDHWQAYGVHETELRGEQTVSREVQTMRWDVALNPRALRVSQREADEMGLGDLHAYLHTHERTLPAAAHYQLVYWQRLIQPLTTVVMMLLAIPCVFGPLRASTMGSKLLAGVSIGFGFHLINRFFGPISHVLHWPAWVAACLPTLVFGALSVYLMRQVRR